MTKGRARTGKRRERRAAPPARAPRVRSAPAVLRFTGRLVRGLVFPVLAAGVVAAVVLLGMFPARAYVDQKQAIADAQTRLDNLTAGNKKSEEDLARLSTDAEVERVAREQLRLVKPGEEVYQIMPVPQDPLVVPDAWPFDGMRTRMGAEAPPPVDAAAAANPASTSTTAATTTTTEPAHR
ncbi:MAG: septum formation initiator family protein [Actinobacteria bacterium]|nr:septum formation initiator family protein [Actinomycetota bacterium]